jgi:hypothetical protein
MMIFFMHWFWKQHCRCSFLVIVIYIHILTTNAFTYDHRTLKTRSPIRSAIVFDDVARMVTGIRESDSASLGTAPQAYIFITNYMYVCTDKPGRESGGNSSIASRLSCGHSRFNSVLLLRESLWRFFSASRRLLWSGLS